MHIVASNFIADSSVARSSIDPTCEHQITAEKTCSPTQKTEGLSLPSLENKLSKRVRMKNI